MPERARPEPVGTPRGREDGGGALTIGCDPLLDLRDLSREPCDIAGEIVRPTGDRLTTGDEVVAPPAPEHPAVV
jgi:hypothetical protein